VTAIIVGLRIVALAFFVASCVRAARDRREEGYSARRKAKLLNRL